jgi:hypothetical protein
MNVGRRPLFFLAIALVCVVLLPFTPREFRAVNLGCAGLAVFWAVLLAFEDIATSRAADGSDAEDDRPSPPG